MRILDDEKMKTRYIAIGATIFFLIGIAISFLSFESITSEHQEHGYRDMIPITPTVGKMTNPVGVPMIIVSILVLIGTGIYSLIKILKRKINEN